MAKNWYVVHTYSGFEKFVAESIRQRAIELSLEDQFGQIIIPTEDVIEIKAGRKVVSTKRSYPGYILVEMEMSDENWHLVRETPKVTGFVGSGRKPSPLNRDEVGQIVEHMETTSEKPKPKHSFEKGEAVRIIDGPFFNFNGIVEEVNHEKSTLKVLVTIFGRSTPVELEFLQVERSRRNICPRKSWLGSSCRSRRARPVRPRRSGRPWASITSTSWISSASSTRKPGGWRRG